MSCDTAVLLCSLVMWLACASLCGYLYVTRTESLPALTVNTHASDTQP